MSDFNRLVQDNELPCTKEDPELFYPASQLTELNREQVQRAKSVCSPCPIRWECLLNALDIEDTHAILGGTTPDERYQMQHQGIFVTAVAA